MKQFFEIATPSLVEYSQQLVQKTQEGWVLDVDDVNTCPTFLGNLYVVTLVKSDTNTPEIAPEVVAEAHTESAAQKPKRVPPQRKTVG